MTKEKVFDIFKDVLSKAGWEDVVSLSESTNELADIMIYQRENDDEYLAANGRPLFPFPAIKNILYQYGPENFYNYVGTEVQFVIELQGNSEYIFEFGENDNIELMNFNGEWITEYKLIVDALAQYNHQIAYRINMECLVKSVLEIIEGHDTIDELDLKEIQGVVNQYIERNPADLDFLFHYAYISLEILCI